MKNRIFLFIICMSNILLAQTHTPNTSKTLPTKWKVYTNSKYGFAFQYPVKWVKVDKEAEILSQLGEVSTVEIYFTDSSTKTILLVAYHLAPNGKDLFHFNHKQYQSKSGWYKNNAGLKISVAGMMAIQATDTLSHNGKGVPLNPTLKSVIVDFLDKKKTGTFELQFKAPLASSQGEESKFKHLLSTFSFLK